MNDLEFDELVMKIIKATNIPKDELMAKINAKMSELSGLVSRKGAAHIIANNLGVQVNDTKKGKTIKISEIAGELSNITVKGIVTRVFPINEFNKEGKTGKVGSVIINDGTGEARLVFWNESSEIISSGHLSKNDFIKIHHLRSKKGLYGPELHFNSQSRIELNPDEKPPEIKSTGNITVETKRHLICDLQEGISAEVKGCVVKLTDRNPFYNVCPKCQKSVKENNCKEHGSIEPTKALLANAIIDDGTGTIRCVFFKEQAETLLGCSTDYAVKKAKETSDETAILKEKQEILGDELVIIGKVVKNSFNENLEIITNTITRLNPLAEIKKHFLKIDSKESN